MKALGWMGRAALKVAWYIFMYNFIKWAVVWGIEQQYAQEKWRVEHSWHIFFATWAVLLLVLYSLIKVGVNAMKRGFASMPVQEEEEGEMQIPPNSNTFTLTQHKGTL